MRIIILLLLVSFIVGPAFSQRSSKKEIKEPIPSKKEIQSTLSEELNGLNAQIADTEKQLAAAKKNKEDPDTIKDLEEQLKMLKKQANMIGGLNKNLSNISDQVMQQATDQDNDNDVPKRDQKRINSIRKKSLTDQELPSYIKSIHVQVEKTIPAKEMQEALKIYEETKSKWKSAAAVSNAAAGCWIYGHWEKALYLEGKACLENPNDPNNLNNYASYLTMVGAEHAALPILQYLVKKYPENSTIMNDIGQAWYGLGDIDEAKKYLESAKSL